MSVRPGALRGSLRRADFLRATRQGRRSASEYFLLYLSERKDSGPARLGITVTRKVGNAVRRNRIKRLVREWFRKTGKTGKTRKTGTTGHMEIDGCDLVVIAKREIPSELVLDQVCADLDRVLKC